MGREELVGGELAPVPVPVTAVRIGLDAPHRRTDWAADSPIWLLDVDGVLNAVTQAPDHLTWPDYRSGFATARGRRWPITYSPTVTSTVAQLSETRSAEVLWLTTWEDEANGDLVELLGLPRLPLAGRAAATSTEASCGWWKLQVARVVHQLSPSRPIVWTDDDLAFDVAAREWIRDRGLGISPATRLGLDGGQLQVIREFVRR